MNPSAFPSADAWLVTGLLAIGVIATIAYNTGSLADERRQRRDVPRSEPPGPLAVNHLIQIDAGIHRGLAGWVHDLFVDVITGQEMVTVRLNDGGFVVVERKDVSRLFAG